MIIQIPNHFVTERSYTLHVIFKTLLGLAYKLEINPELDRVMILLQNHQIILIDHFFKNAANPELLYSDEFLPQKVIKGTGLLHELIILYGADHIESSEKGVVIHADIIASAFFMLSRWEEIHSEKDKHHRFQGIHSIAFLNDFHLRPIVNEYADFLKNLLAGFGIEAPEVFVFRKILTCDVDMPFYWMKNPVRKLIGSIFQRSSLSPGFPEKWHSYRNSLKDFHVDPYYTFIEMLEAVEENGMEACFYFMSGGNTTFDRYYEVEDPRINSLIRQISDRGHMIGLHGSYASYTDSAMLMREKSRLEDVFGYEVKDTRQHYLRFSVNETPLILEEVGFVNDSTLGYADIPGFRNGICHPFPLYNMKDRKISPVIEMPLILMDATLKHYMNLNVQDGVKIIDQLLETVRKYNGVFVFLWHNSSFEYGGYDGYRPVYNSLLSH